MTRRKWKPITLPGGETCRHTPTDTHPETGHVTCTVCGTTWANTSDWASECLLTARPPWINLANTTPPQRLNVT